MNGIKMCEFELALRLTIWKLYKEASRTSIIAPHDEVHDLLTKDSKMIGFRYIPLHPFKVVENNGAVSIVTVSCTAYYNDTQFSSLDSEFTIGITNSDFGMTITCVLSGSKDPTSFIYEREIRSISFNGEEIDMTTYEGYVSENLKNNDRITDILIKLSAMLS